MPNPSFATVASVAAAIAACAAACAAATPATICPWQAPHRPAAIPARGCPPPPAGVAVASLANSRQSLL